MEKCRVLATHTPDLLEAAVQEAVRLLRAGEAVVLPTETVYGLAANALDSAAVEKIFAVKGRPAHNPVIVHVASLEMAQHCVKEWPRFAAKLANAFWPGPLTLVLPRANRISDLVTARGPTVGVRWPRHPVIEAVIRVCGFPLAAPSANLSGQVSPTSAEHARASLGEKVPLILDGGPAQVGIESTVLDLTASPPRLLRPGMIHAESLAAVTGDLTLAGSRADEILRSPGLLHRHYAPKARLVVWSWTSEAGLKSRISNHKFEIGETFVIAHSRIPLESGYGQVCVLPRDPEACGRALYSAWHRCDAAGAKLIVVEAPPESVEWQAIADRLRRASA
jgi:L-threonylcarbamoyladenylate synthase